MNETGCVFWWISEQRLIIYDTLCLHGALLPPNKQPMNERLRETFQVFYWLMLTSISGGLMVGCRAGEMLTVVHRATNSSVRRLGTSMVEYASIQGKVWERPLLGLTWRAESEYEVNVLNDVHISGPHIYFVCICWIFWSCTSHQLLRCVANLQEARLSLRHLGDLPHRHASFFSREEVRSRAFNRTHTVACHCFSRSGRHYKPRL